MTSSDSSAANRQESATRVGICLNDYEQFWWNADANPVCPACSLDDEDYAKQHQFYIAETEPDA